MRKQYLSTLLSLALVLGVASVVSAQDANIDASVDAVETRETDARPDSRRGKNLDEIRALRDSQRAQIEAQREKMRAEFEARKAEAEARGDEVQVKREALKLELETRRAEHDAQREARRVEAEAKRAEKQAERIEFQRDIALRKAEHAAKVILATIGRLENIILRIESRIAKVQARGGVTTESERYVALAKGNLRDALALVEVFASLDLSSDRAQDNFEKVRATAAEIREHIRAAHRHLMLAVRALSSVDADAEINEENEEDSSLEQ
jgi:TolA-binding protein